MTRTFKTIYATILAIVVGVMLANGAMAGERLSRSFDDLTWVKGGPGLQFAKLWGDWDKGNYGMIVKIKAGQTVPEHSHTADYHGITLQGKWVQHLRSQRRQGADAGLIRLSIRPGESP